MTMPSMVARLVLLVLGIVAVTNAQLVNVKPVITNEPGGGYITGGLRFPAIIKVQLLPNRNTYRCNVSATASLLLSPRSTATGASLTGNATVNSTTGILTFEDISTDTPGSLFHLQFDISVEVNGGISTFQLVSAAFHVAGTPPPSGGTTGSGGSDGSGSGSGSGSGGSGSGGSGGSPPTPPTPPAGPPPTMATTFELQLTDPIGSDACTPFQRQPVLQALNFTGAHYIVANVAFDVVTDLLNPWNNAELMGATTASTTDGTAAFHNMSICMPGFGYNLRFNVTFADGSTKSIVSSPVTMTGTIPPTPVPATPAPGGVAEPATPAPVPSNIDNGVLGFIVQPAGGVANMPLRFQPQLVLRDRYSHGIIATTISCTASLYVPGFLASLNPEIVGTLTVNSSEGVAQFNDLSITQLGWRYHIMFTMTAHGRSWQVYSQAVYVEAANQRDALVALNAAPEISTLDTQPHDADTRQPPQTQEGEEGLAATALVAICIAAVVVVVSMGTVLAIWRRNKTAQHLSRPTRHNHEPITSAPPTTHSDNPIVATFTAEDGVSVI